MSFPEIDKLFEGVTAVSFIGDDCTEGDKVQLAFRKPGPTVAGTLAEVSGVLSLDAKGRKELVSRMLEMMLSEAQEEF